MPWIVIAPTISAITALGGMPSVSIGMKEVCAPALLADSGPATPWIAPFPNGTRGLRTYGTTSDRQRLARGSEPATKKPLGSRALPSSEKW